MNYSAIYYKLVAKAMSRQKPEGYTERHYVIPRSMGGTDAPSNIVVLTAIEHLHAHRLLVRMFPHRKGLAKAVVIMCGGKKGREANKLYEMDRKRTAEAARAQMLGSVGNNRGRKFSDEVRANMSKGSQGQNLGRKNTPETIEKMRTSAQARCDREALQPSNPNKSGWKHSEESRAKMAMNSIGKNLGSKRSEETKAKMRATWAAKCALKETI